MNFLINIFLKDKIFTILIVVIVFDLIFGILRSIKEKNINSCIGIDGIIRKTGMLICIILTKIIDYLMQIDLLFLIPDSIKEILKINKCGINLLFDILFITFETLSVIKNMYKCNLPIPIKLQNILEKILKEFTEEIKNDKNNN